MSLDMNDATVYKKIKFFIHLSYSYMCYLRIADPVDLEKFIHRDYSIISTMTVVSIES